MNLKHFKKTNSNNLNRKILVFSKSYEAALGIGRSLRLGGATNVDLYYVGTDKPVIDKSNVFQNKYYNSRNDDQAIIDDICEKYKRTDEKVVLFPGDDYSTSLVDRNRKSLEEIFLYTYVDSEEEAPITHLMDKQYQTVIARKFDMPMAKSWVLTIDNQRYKVPNDLTYPCFVKPLVSANGPAKSIIRKLNDFNSLANYLGSLTKKGYTYPVLVQEFIEIEEEYNIHGICDGERLFLPLIHRKLQTANHNKGVTILGKNLNPSHLGENIDKLKAILLSCNYHGIFNVEMFKSKGIVYLNEINFRIAGTCWGTTGAGANLPYLWVNVLLGNVKEWPSLTPKYDSVFINDKTAMEDLLNGYCGLGDYLRWNRSAAYHLIKNSSDKGPWRVFFMKLVRAYLGKTRVKFLDNLKNKLNRN